MSSVDSITFRSCIPEDRAFLRQVYASTRMEEMALAGWAEKEVEVFLDMQFFAQHKFYHDNYTAARFLIIERHGENIGRLYREVRETEIRIIDIALLPQYRQQGIGGRIMKDILKEATERSLRVGIHVERNNPALKLYERLGFQAVGDTGVYFHMEYKAHQNERENDVRV